MIFTRCLRRFHADGTPVVLAKDFAFVAVPTTGTKLTFAGEDLPPLTVVGVTLRSTTTAAGEQPVALEVELEYEPLSAADVARERGWEPIA